MFRAMDFLQERSNHSGIRFNFHFFKYIHSGTRFHFKHDSPFSIAGLQGAMYLEYQRKTNSIVTISLLN